MKWLQSVLMNGVAMMHGLLSGLIPSKRQAQDYNGNVVALIAL